MKLFFPLIAVLTVGSLAGCQTSSGALSAGPQSTKYSIENTGRFERIDHPVALAVTCTGLQERRTDDGRLSVVANIKNQETAAVQLQVRCVFKDEHGFSTGDESAWQTLDLGPGATEAVHYTAVNALAHKYTIAVRPLRGS